MKKNDLEFMKRLDYYMNTFYFQCPSETEEEHKENENLNQRFSEFYNWIYDQLE